MGIESFRYLFNEDLKLIDLKNVSNILRKELIRIKRLSKETR